MVPQGGLGAAIIRRVHKTTSWGPFQILEIFFFFEVGPGKVVVSSGISFV